jgi:hypothetical protein
MFTARWHAAALLGSCVTTLVACATLPNEPAAYPAALPARTALQFKFTTLDDVHDPAFNRLLGINNEEKIAGYYGSGATGHPNRGYIIFAPYRQANFKDHDYPSAADTVVTSLSNTHAFAGFYVATTGETSGFIETNGLWFNYADRYARQHDPVTELLGLNDAGIAVGFYTPASNVNVAVTLDVVTGKFHPIATPSGEAAVASGITGTGHIVGFLKKRSGSIVGFLIKDNVLGELSFPGSTDTKALGVTTYDQIVGSYVDAAGATHGFMLTNPLTKRAAWQPIDDPDANGTTVVSGINDHGHLVGYYVDRSGKTHGFLAVPQR